METARKGKGGKSGKKRENDKVIKIKGRRYGETRKGPRSDRKTWTKHTKIPIGATQPVFFCFVPPFSVEFYSPVCSSLFLIKTQRPRLSPEVRFVDGVISGKFMLLIESFLPQKVKLLNKRKKKEKKK